MRSEVGKSIQAHMAAVNVERAARARNPSLHSSVEAIKGYQQRRFELTYADLLGHPRYAGAANFFLAELYGPADFTQRDAEFSRIIPALVRLFPDEVLDTVDALAELHALSERFDSEMGRAAQKSEIDAQVYIQAWQRCEGEPARERQIALMERVGRALDALTHKPLLHQSLRLMRTPARAAGLSALQAFLEKGFDTFRGMGGADEFLNIIGSRERSLSAWLFSVAANSTKTQQKIPP